MVHLERSREKTLNKLNSSYTDFIYCIFLLMSDKGYIYKWRNATISYCLKNTVIKGHRLRKITKLKYYSFRVTWNGISFKYKFVYKQWGRILNKMRVFLSIHYTFLFVITFYNNICLRGTSNIEIFWKKVAEKFKKIIS